ncbi:tRNA (adenosine(37)-N6)-threonylcarbamoyltransferase complex dimerization subunit type 1 TsaB [Sporosarcina thermotolerans]|uniref:tRNA (adenosine(37)-N6)-threonylcarbamoyltransferase complex dimerization subunit type 1 TsaB n=1 Tax=Sporosarcina thermotolerans TaxID=633404 RepID=UPI0024BD2925|nr:tRNA (adenosine(37)-N6)-threonylcarbamoyltransferase complex dimerization subunit type 1 TsaB [Sporosarcina thermotolerans]WHT49126.1 tRNA (adenosine(37)-N6)-threonylcarbamoyltransferase complex dimerization subunit type 1 TsaB [Sporosarcina thermotolerans]
MIWLGIDTANTPLSVAIVKDGAILAEVNSSMAVNHSLRAMPVIEELFETVQLKPKDIDAIAVSEGPGSYTGVRIGVTIAKTLAWTLKKPLVGVSSLKTLAANAIYFNGLICPVVDARRNNVYAGVYENIDGALVAIHEDRHLGIEALLDSLGELDCPVLFIGKDVGMYEELITNRLKENSVIAPFPMNLPRASSLIYIAQQSGHEENTHAFTPEYRRIAEAEANWLMQQTKEKGSE